MSNHNKIRPVNKNNLNGKYKILFLHPKLKIAISQWSSEVYKSIIVNF